MSTTITINGFRVNPDRLFLRTSNNGESHDGFRRNPIGQWNDAGERWTGEPARNTCGGFFGIDLDANGFGLPQRRTLELCEWRGERVSISRNKICVSSYRVVAVNSNIAAARDTHSAVADLLIACRVAVVGEGDEEKICRGVTAYIYGGVAIVYDGGEARIFDGGVAIVNDGGEASVFDGGVARVYDGGEAYAYDAGATIHHMR